MRLVLATLGSHGDVHPFIAIGRALRARGHEVTLICNDDFRDLALQAGMHWASAGVGRALDTVMAQPQTWHPIQGHGVIWKHLLKPAIEPTFRHIERIAAGGPTTVVALPVMFGARFARDALGVRLISAYTAPSVLRSDGAPLKMAHWHVPRGTPRAVVRLAWRALDRYKLHPMARYTLQRHAGEYGTPPPADRSIFGDWMNSPDGGITLFPDWFAPRRAGWPEQVQFGGFPLFDDLTHAPLADDVGRFLAAGAPPVVFMPGSAMRHGRAFFAAAVEACARRGWRAVLLTPDRSQLPDTLPTQVLHAAYLPFEALLPQAAALVHHGGIGSCAQALRAGIPQVVTPMAYDQFDNGDCIERIGAGVALRSRLADGAGLARALQTALALPAERRLAWQSRLTEPALPRLCQLIEDIGQRPVDRPLNPAVGDGAHRHGPHAEPPAGHRAG